MSIYTLDETTLSNLARDIEAIPPRPHHSGLLEIANRICPGCTFRYALNRGGWYRPGGLIDAKGVRIAESLGTWARIELDACDGDMGELVERNADKGLLVTRHTGRTHYFVAAYGSAPSDFLQFEVEELQEVLDRKLIDNGKPPEDLQELIEPIAPEVTRGASSCGTALPLPPSDRHAPDRRPGNSCGIAQGRIAAPVVGMGAQQCGVARPFQRSLDSCLARTSGSLSQSGDLGIAGIAPRA